MAAVRVRQVSLVKAAKFVDAQVDDLNRQVHEHVCAEWVKEFPAYACFFSAGFMMGSHTTCWEPEMLLYSVDQLCYTRTGFWYDPTNYARQVVKTMPDVKRIEEFCKRMSYDVACKVFFHKHEPPAVSNRERFARAGFKEDKNA